ncbi:MAG: low affinity iron permease family protein [Methylobacter sp.]|uniref:low affinity iron permease family protein n=1 Tax=Methylobacter sp. TaxID=2051955 RepID=UPI00272F7FCA|nr:low affinity iron permease family protein [Methylobacter sp.]MDP1663924.1 low affinity iron permease family protein [Methylobacter sp.]
MMTSNQLEIFISRISKWAGSASSFVAALFSDDFDKKEIISDRLEVFTHRFAKWTGSAGGFVAALLSILVWLVGGLAYEFSQDWERGLTIYIGVITFLMVFLIQRGQNKELSILQVKLNELIAVTQHADNRLINVEDLTEKEISAVQEIHHKIGEEDV